MAIRGNIAAIIVVMMAAIVLAIGIAVARAFIVHNGVGDQLVSTSSVTSSSGIHGVVYEW